MNTTVNWDLIKSKIDAKRHNYSETFSKHGYIFVKKYEDETMCIYAQKDKETLITQYYEGFKKNKNGLYPSSSEWGVRAWTFKTNLDTAKELLIKKIKALSEPKEKETEQKSILKMKRTKNKKQTNKVKQILN